MVSDHIVKATCCVARARGDWASTCAATPYPGAAWGPCGQLNAGRGLTVAPTD